MDRRQRRLRVEAFYSCIALIATSMIETILLTESRYFAPAVVGAAHITIAIVIELRGPGSAGCRALLESIGDDLELAGAIGLACG